MKVGYKVAIGVNIVYAALQVTPIKLPPIIENAMGFIVVVALFHAIFIAKSPPKEYTPYTVRREQTWYEKERDWRWYQEQQKNNYWK